jgi:hypothetical protein
MARLLPTPARASVTSSWPTFLPERVPEGAVPAAENQHECGSS